MKLRSLDRIGDMPKLLSPFEREMIAGRYVCVLKIKEEFRWVFTEEAKAVEKLDGTNISIVVEGGRIKEIYNRENRIEPFAKGNKRFAEGILETIEREYFEPKKAEDGQYFGELIGERVNGNPYGIKGHLWLQLSNIKERYYFKFWNDFVKTLQGISDEEIFNNVSETMKGLWSIYKRKQGFEKTPVDENTKFEGMAAEGIVFYREGHEIKPATIDGRRTVAEMCKLRRDMFSWFKGEQHEA